MRLFYLFIFLLIIIIIIIVGIRGPGVYIRPWALAEDVEWSENKQTIVKMEDSEPHK